MTRRAVGIRIVTKRTELAESFFEAPVGNEPDEWDLLDAESEDAEFFTEGRLITSQTEVRLVYEEGELSGMEGSVACLAFTRENPGLVTLTRQGEVSTALVFEEGQRHICVYTTPFMDFEVCIKSYLVRNLLLEKGRVDLDYIVEIHGAKAERCRMTITIENQKKLFAES